MKSRFVALLAVTAFLLLSGTSVQANEFTDWLLGRNNLGSNDCTWDGCRCCDDYCPKCAPCIPGVATCSPGCYCPKPWPCVPEVCPSVCPNYCPKPWPCLWKPMCGPYNWCGPTCAPPKPACETCK